MAVFSWRQRVVKINLRYPLQMIKSVTDVLSLHSENSDSSHLPTLIKSLTLVLLLKFTRGLSRFNIIGRAKKLDANIRDCCRTLIQLMCKIAKV